MKLLHSGVFVPHFPQNSDFSGLFECRPKERFMPSRIGVCSRKAFGKENVNSIVTSSYHTDH